MKSEIFFDGLTLDVRVETWTNSTPLRIAGRTLHGVDVVVARVSSGKVSGEGEAAGVYYYRETAESMAAQLRAVAKRVASGVNRVDLLGWLPAGGARNALDCALWAYEARVAGCPAWSLAGTSPPRSLVTTYTVGVELPEVMAARAVAFVDRGCIALKLKMNGDGEDLARVKAVRDACPLPWIGIDANRSWGLAQLKALASKMAALNVSLIEQPLEIGDDEQLRGWVSPVPLAVDESFQDRRDLERLAGLYQVANIKLDKTGGLTEALACVEAGRRLGYQLMVGNMAGTSLAMAPAFLVGQGCTIVDLDGPLYFVADREPETVYEHGRILEPRGWDVA